MQSIWSSTENFSPAGAAERRLNDRRRVIGGGMAGDSDRLFS